MRERALPDPTPHSPGLPGFPALRIALGMGRGRLARIEGAHKIARRGWQAFTCG